MFYPDYVLLMCEIPYRTEKIDVLSRLHTCYICLNSLKNRENSPAPLVAWSLGHLHVP